jgi:hypothetical protein
MGVAGILVAATGPAALLSAEDSTTLPPSLSNALIRSARSGMRYGLGMNSIASVWAAAVPLHAEVSRMRMSG